MASPRCLDNFFTHWPEDVKRIIFEYGFHIWLAIPHEMEVDVYPPQFGAYVAVCVTVRMVHESQLSWAWSGTNYERYKAQVLSTFHCTMPDPAVRSFTVTSDDIDLARQLPHWSITTRSIHRISPPIPSRPGFWPQLLWYPHQRLVWVCFGGRADLTYPGFTELGIWDNPFVIVDMPPR